MKILPIKPVETLSVRPVAIATLPDRTMPTLGLPPNIIPTLPTTMGGNTGIVPPYLQDRITASRTAVNDARHGAYINPGVVPPWMVDSDSPTDLVAPDGPVGPDTPRIL